jgi:hypothetical protein
MAKLTHNVLTREIRDIVTEYSHLPDAIIRMQCRGIGKEPAQIAHSDLVLLAERIGDAVGKFTNPEKGNLVRLRILALKSV